MIGHLYTLLFRQAASPPAEPPPAPPRVRYGSGPGPMIYRKPGEDRKPFQSRRRRRNEALLFSGAL